MHFIYRNLRSCHRSIMKFSVNTLNPCLTCYNYFSSNDSPANALKNLFGCTYNQAYTLVRKYPELKKLDSARISRAGELLKRLNIDQHDLKRYPQILSLLPSVIEQRALILRESGFSKITLQNIVYYGLIVRRKIALLKRHGCIPEYLDVSKNLLECLQASPEIYECVNKSIEGKECDMTISFMRDLVLECYVQHMLDASEDEVRYIFTTYSRINNKSLLLINETMKILIEELQFSKNHVKSHGYLFYAHPWELRKLIKNFPSLGGVPIRDFLHKHPVVATSSYEAFSQTVKVLKEAGISEEAILEAPMVFTLSVPNIQKGLDLLKSDSIKPEIKALLSHPQMLKLVVHHDSVSQRLNYLKNFEEVSHIRPVTSLNLLCGSSKGFERYVSGVGGTNRGNDVVIYITKTLLSECKSDDDRDLVTPASVRESLKRHAHWRNVPLFEIQSCLEMLLSLGFTWKEIMTSLQIVLYSPSKVITQLKRLSQENILSSSLFDDGLKKFTFEEGSERQPDVEDLQHEKISVPSQLKQHALPLCLYFLEKDHNFSGDGIWFRQ